MGYYASGYGTISFYRSLKDEEREQLSDVLGREFDMGFSDRSDLIDLYTDGNYHEDEVYEVLNEVARAFPIQSGSIEFHGDDECFWKMDYHPELEGTDAASCWVEHSGSIVYEDDNPQYVYVLLHHWDSDASEGFETKVFSASSLALARQYMRMEAAKIRAEYEQLYGKDLWEKDYTWENDDEIHLGFDPRGFMSNAVVYSWRLERQEVTGS